MNAAVVPGLLSKFARSILPKRNGTKSSHVRRPFRSRPRLEALEDRLAPALNLTIGMGAMPTTGVAITTVGNTTTFSPQITNAFLNVLDLNRPISMRNVVVRSGISGSDAGVLTVNSGLDIVATGGSLVLQAGTNFSVLGGSQIQDDVSTLTIMFGSGPGTKTASALIQGYLRSDSIPQIMGQATSSNSVTVNYWNFGAAPDGLNYSGKQGANNMLTLSDAGGGIKQHTYVVTATSVTRDTDMPVTFSTMSLVSVVGGGIRDTFNVSTAGAASAPMLNVVGGPGADVLNLDQPAPVGTFPGGIALNGARVLTYSDVSTINFLNPAGVNAMYGPNFAGRSAAFAGLNVYQRFVQAIYLDALGRAGSLQELATWTVVFQFQTLTRAQAQNVIATGIENSVEARNYLVNSWFQTYLNRAANAGEAQKYVDMLAAGTGKTEEQVLSAFLASGEFFLRAQFLIPSGTQQQRYVQALYNLMLFRNANPTELQGWINRFATLGQAGVALGILGSGEFRTNQFTGYYNALLHQPADPVSLPRWVAMPMGMRQIRITFYSTALFFTNG